MWRNVRAKWLKCKCYFLIQVKTGWALIKSEYIVYKSSVINGFFPQGALTLSGSLGEWEVKIADEYIKGDESSPH